MNAPAQIIGANIHAAHFNRAKPGPQVGAPPSLEQVPVDRLSVDPAYQRATDSEASRRIIVGMVKQWDWSLCQPLVVARRPDGGLFILDGQHRHLGATERGDIAYLPCVILSSLGIEAEARTFVGLNTIRQKLTQADVFHGMLAAGDADAKAVQALLESTGWRVARHRNYAAYKPGDLECAPMLVRTLAAKGDATVRFALTALRAAYPDTTTRQCATLLKALFDVFEALMDGQIETAPLIAALGAIQPDLWISRAIIHRDSHPGLSSTAALAATMIAAARNKAAAAPGKPAATPPTAPVSPPPRTLAPSPMKRPAPASTNPFGTTGKGWCTQCEQLRSKPAASACGSQFCTLRRFT